MSEEDIRAFRLSVNRMGELAEWDEELLRRELETLDAGGEDLALDGPVGIGLEEIDEEIDVGDWDMGPTRDLFVVTLTGSLPLEPEALK